MKLNKL